MTAPTTRRELLRAGAATIGGVSATVSGVSAAVSGFSSVRRAASGDGLGDDSHDDSEDGDIECDGVEARDGYVFSLDRYRECVRFQFVAELQVFRASVGRGLDISRNDRRDFTAYGIRYVDGGGDGTSEESAEDGDMVILAVPSPDHEESPSLFEYYLPRTRFQFTESKGEFVFQRNSSNPRTLALRTEFVRDV